MKLDFKKDKVLYQTKTTPTIVDVPEMNYIAFNGYGNPSSDESNFKYGIGLLYPVAYTLSMSYKGARDIKDFVNYVVPPLEGMWWQKGINGYDPSRKDLFEFILLIRLPDFISKEDVSWAIETCNKKKGTSFNEVYFKTIKEGLVVQSLHIGDYDSEFQTTKIMDDFITNDYELDFSDIRHHHEIYISDARKTDPSKLKTILRHPIRLKK